jgi:hypothetical protein
MVALVRTAWNQNLGHTTVMRELTEPLAGDFARIRRRRQP